MKLQDIFDWIHKQKNSIFTYLLSLQSTALLKICWCYHMLKIPLLIHYVRHSLCLWIIYIHLCGKSDFRTPDGNNESGDNERFTACMQELFSSFKTCIAVEIHLSFWIFLLLLYVDLCALYKGWIISLTYSISPAIISASYDRTVKLWDRNTKKQVHESLKRTVRHFRKFLIF